MPSRRIQAYLTMLPQLEAERSLARIQETAAAFGSLNERDQARYINALQRTAAGVSTKPEKATVASLALIGIAVETVAPTPKKKVRKPRAGEPGDRGPRSGRGPRSA